MFHTRAFQIMLDIFIGSRYDKVGLPGSKVGRSKKIIKFFSYFLHRHMDNVIQTTDKMHQKIASLAVKVMELCFLINTYP